MCGIAGILNLAAFSADNLLEICAKMTNSLIHRGPDDNGFWTSSEATIALGHRRLSILDISPEGHQPMVSACGRYVIVYNGEVYNYLAIRNELERQGQASKFRGHSDTEVILAAISTWGVKKTVTAMNGIFAFAVWDKKVRELSLVRDRIGVKPLYYGWAGESLVFGSELKALVKHPRFDRTINRNSLALYFRHNYIPAPYSIYQKAFKLEPGNILTLSSDVRDVDSHRPLKSERYWSPQQVWLAGASNPWTGDEKEALDELENLLTDAVKSQMISDVPLGAFLSGGIDSSTVTALMQSSSSMPVKTFSIGFHASGYDEAVFAKKIANYLGTNHTELYVTDKEAQDVIPLLPQIYDEPFADSSQIPTYLVSRLARQHVTVSLSGDGGDELFSGYNDYMVANKLWHVLSSVPRPLKNLGQRAIDLLPLRALDILGYPFNLIVKVSGYKAGRMGDRLKKYSQLMSQNSPRQIYRTITSHFSARDNPTLFSTEPPTFFSEILESDNKFDFFQLMSLLDILVYLPDDILVKVDRASMAVALEARVPILDHRVVEFASTLPTNMKIRNGSGKWILKKLLSKYVPSQLTERPKMGFGVPVGDWLRGPLRQWASDLLNEKNLSRDGFLDSKKITHLWLDHVSHRRDWSYRLWGILMFQSWLHG